MYLTGAAPGWQEAEGLHPAGLACCGTLLGRRLSGVPNLAVCRTVDICRPAMVRSTSTPAIKCKGQRISGRWSAAITEVTLRLSNGLTGRKAATQTCHLDSFAKRGAFDRVPVERECSERY